MRGNRCPCETGIPCLSIGGVLITATRVSSPRHPHGLHFLPLNTRCHFAPDWVKVGPSPKNRVPATGRSGPVRRRKGDFRQQERHPLAKTELTKTRAHRDLWTAVQV